MGDGEAKVFCGADLWSVGKKCCPECTHGDGKGEACQACGAKGLSLIGPQEEEWKPPVVTPLKGVKRKGFSQAEYESHMKKLSAALIGAPDLLRYLDKNHPEGDYRIKVPFGLVTGHIKPGDFFEVVIEPYTAIRPWAMVLKDECADAFDLCDFRVGHVITSGNTPRIPLETLAMRYFAGAKDPGALLDVQDWGGGLVVDPGMKLCIRGVNTSKVNLPFRGILWAKSVAF